MAVLTVYFQVVEHDFMRFDDDLYVYENPHVIRGISWAGVGWAFTSMRTSNWHPLTWLSHMLDCQLFGLNAGYHHLTSVFLHILNSILLYLLLKTLTGAVWRSAVVAGLFALHPLHVESVAWVSERKDVLSALFFMLTLWVYVRYVARPCWQRYSLVFGCLALGLMAKPMLVTVPFVLLLLDYWPLGRFECVEASESEATQNSSAKGCEGRKPVPLQLIVEKVPLFVLAGLSSVVTFVAQQRGGAVVSITAVPVSSRIANALVTYVAYVGKMMWPSRLAVFYPPRYELSTVQWACAAVVLLGISVLVVWASRRWRYLAVGWFWYLGMLVPVIGLVQVGRQAMADRYTYLPLTGLFLMAVWGIADLTGRWRHRRTGLAVLAVIVILGCMAGTWFQVRLWQSGLTLLTHTLKVTKSNGIAHNNLGVALLELGNPEEAILHYREALRIDPKQAVAHNNLGIALMKTGRSEEAITHFQEALRIDPRNAPARTNLGVCLAARGMTEEAIVQYKEALRSAPDDPRPYNNLAWIRATNPDPRFRNGVRAVESAEKACDLWGYEDPGFLDTLAAAYAEAGRFSEAVATARKAVSLSASLGSKEAVQELKKRLHLYTAGRPFRENESPPE